jgi:hypothetical protein
MSARIQGCKKKDSIVPSACGNYLCAIRCKCLEDPEARCSLRTLISETHILLENRPFSNLPCAIEMPPTRVISKMPFAYLFSFNTSREKPLFFGACFWCEQNIWRKCFDCRIWAQLNVSCNSLSNVACICLVIMQPVTAVRLSCRSCWTRFDNHHCCMFEGRWQCVDSECNAKWSELCGPCRSESTWLFSWPRDHWDGETFRVSKYQFYFSDKVRMPACMACDAFNTENWERYPWLIECYACGAVNPAMVLFWEDVHRIQQGPREA